MAMQFGHASQGQRSLTEVRQEIEMGLARHLQTIGPERCALTIRLRRLQWEAEDLESANQAG